MNNPCDPNICEVRAMDDCEAGTREQEDCAWFAAFKEGYARGQRELAGEIVEWLEAHFPKSTWVETEDGRMELASGIIGAPRVKKELEAWLKEKGALDG